MLTPATITVNFLGNYAGPHRVCWRVQGSGNPYVCTNIVTCVGGGNPCQAIINIMVESESCTDTIFEGYIQATCQPEGSSTDQVPFTVTYTPTPSCKFYKLTNPYPGPVDLFPSDLGLNCDGTARPTVHLSGRQVLKLCGIAGMPQNIIDEYNVQEDITKCCSECVSGSVKAIEDAPTNVYYIDCTTKQLMVAIAPASSATLPLIIGCLVTGSLSPESPITTVNLGAC